MSGSIAAAPGSLGITRIARSAHAARQPARCALLACALLLLSGSLQAVDTTAKDLEWARTREQARTARVDMAKGAAQDRVARAGKAAAVVAALLEKAPANGAGRDDRDLGDLIAGVRFLAAPAAAPLEAALKALPEAADPAKAKAWRLLVEAKRADVLRPTERLFKQALDGGVLTVARDCVDQVLVFWPDDRDLRRNLGQSEHAGRWYGPRDMALVSQGMVWDEKLGWVVEKDRSRYGKGDYFDLQEKEWTTLSEADTAHGVAAKPWIIQTEHLQIQGTAHLADLVDVANRLEEFYGQIFAAYCGFFVRPGAKQGADLKLLFGMLDHPRLVVNVAKDAAGYRASLPPGVSAGWSAGMFISSTRQSYFYTGYVSAIYHEFTHQILHIFTGRDQGPAWLVEGAAVYTQAPVFVDGHMRLGALDENVHLQAFIKQQRAGKALTLPQVLALDGFNAWSGSATPALNYPAAGSVVQFAMEAEGRGYRADFIDFLRDSYVGQTGGHRLWEYLGLDRPAFDKQYQAWVADFTK